MWLAGEYFPCLDCMGLTRYAFTFTGSLVKMAEASTGKKELTPYRSMPSTKATDRMRRKLRVIRKRWSIKPSLRPNVSIDV